MCETHTNSPWRRLGRRGLVASAAVAAIGLSACERDARPAPESDQRTAQVSVFNATHDVLPLYSQPLSSTFGIDCDLALSDPATFVHDEHLSMPQRQYLFSGEERSVEGVDDRPGSDGQRDVECHVNVVSTADDRLPEIAVSWPRDLPDKSFYSDVDAPSDIPPEAQSLVVDADYSDIDEERLRPWRDRPCGGSIEECSQEEYEAIIEAIDGASYQWSVIGDEPTLHEWDFGSIDDIPVVDESSACTTGREVTPLSWETPPSGTWRVTDVVASPPEDAEESEAGEAEQCFSVELHDEDDDEEWTFCGSQRLAARLASEEKIGTVHARFYTEEHYGSPPSAYEALTVDIERRTDDGERFEAETIEAIRGQGIPEHIGLAWGTTPLTDCEGRREVEACDQMILPLILHVESPGGLLEIPVGQTDYLEPQTQRRIEFVRGMHRVVADRECRAGSIGPYQFAEVGPYLEVIYYGGVATAGEE